MSTIDPLSAEARARIAIVHTMIELGRFVKEHQDIKPPPEVGNPLGATMIMTVSYIRKTLEILEKPTTPQPVMGRRCMFY